MTYCKEYCLEMPDDFPIEEFTHFVAVARGVLLQPEESPAWREFAGASNLIGWRFRASSEDWQSHKQSLATLSNPNHEQLYARERALFGMFTSGVASLESAVYAIAALASHPSVLALPFGREEQRRCCFRRLAKWLKPYAKASALSQVLTAVGSSPEWSLWVTLRNRMTHRSNLPRIIYGAVGAPVPVTKPLVFAATCSSPLVEAETEDFDALRSWLALALRDLMVEASKVPNSL